jgi:hypothetical protein
MMKRVGQEKTHIEHEKERRTERREQGKRSREQEQRNY